MPEKQDQVAVPCCRCDGTTTRHSIIDRANWTHDLEDIITVWEEQQALRCLNCGGLSVRHRKTSTEDVGEGFDAELCWDYFPRTPQRMERPDLTAHCPSPVGLLYSEVVDSYNGGNLRLCTAGIRSLIEGSSKAVDIAPAPDKSLLDRIKVLASAGHIGTKMVGVLELFKDIGNLTLHELVPPTKEELSLLLDVVEHLLESVFVIQEKAQRIAEAGTGKRATEAAKQRREQRKEQRAKRKKASASKKRGTAPPTRKQHGASGQS